MISEILVKDRLKTKYGFENVECNVLSYSRNIIYLIKDHSSSYVFKVYNNRLHDAEEIKGEIELVNILNKRGVSVSYPLKDSDGNEIQNFETSEGVNNGVLFTFAHGKASFNMNEKQLETLGTELANIHNITSNLELTHQLKEYNLSSMLVEPLKNLKPAFKKMEDEYDHLYKIGSKIITRLELLELSKFDYGYCHHDLSPYNLHFEEDDKITFFDFDVAGKGYFLHDIVCIYLHFFNMIRAGLISSERASRSFDTFLDSYFQRRGLSDDQIDAIPYFGFALLISAINFGYQNYDNWPYPDYLKDQLARLKDWIISHKLTE